MKKRGLKVAETLAQGVSPKVSKVSDTLSDVTARLARRRQGV